jgi:hypothetical protein
VTVQSVPGESGIAWRNAVIPTGGEPFTVIGDAENPPASGGGGRRGGRLKARLAVRFATLADGSSYNVQTTLNATAKHIRRDR